MTMLNIRLPIPPADKTALRPSDEVFGTLEAFFQAFCAHPARQREYGMGHLLYACHVAFPVLINADIAYKLWLNFKNYYNKEDITQAIHPLAVSDFLLSKLCRETSLAQYELRPGLRPYLLWLLQEDNWWQEQNCYAQHNCVSFGKQRIDDLASFLQHYVEEHFLPSDTAHRPFREAQLWTADAWLKPEVAATQILKALQHAEENPLLQDYISTLGERLESEYALKVRLGDAKPSSAMATVFAYSKGLKAYRKGDAAQAMRYFHSIPQEDFEERREDEKISLLIPDELAARLNDNLVQISLPSIVLEQIAENKRTRSTFLDLGNCGLTEIPYEVCDLIWLEVLNLSDEYTLWHIDGTFQRKKSNNIGTPNFIQILPSYIGRLTNLRYLTISGEFNNVWPLNDLSPLMSLVQLESLAVQHTEIDDVSPLHGLIHLKGLAIYNTKVTDLSPLSSLINLSRLYAWNIPISDLAPLERLSNLTELNVLYTEISDLSPLSGLTNLKELNIRRTKVSDLSPLANLTNLKELDASYTNISDLSPLSNLSRLKNLNCSNTKISSLEPVANLLKSLNEINFSNCPLTHPPKEIVDQGKSAIIKYFEALAENKLEQVYEANLFIIGDPRVGKTTLCRKLIDLNAPLPNEMESTRGIDISTILFNTSDINGKELRLNVYDFAGQEIYQDIHTIFYTPNSLYVLVINSDHHNDSNEVNDWLQTAEIYGKKSSILLVINGPNHRIDSLDIAYLKSQFPSLKETVSINLASDSKNIELLRQKIVRMSLSLPNISQLIPRPWAEVSSYFDEIRQERPCISYKEFQRICENNGIADHIAQANLSRYFHSIGTFLHFQDNLSLKDTVFLQKQWVADAIYRILDDKLIRESNGRFDQKALTHIWLESAYSDRHAELLALMLQFEICYPMTDSKTYICPQLLPYDSLIPYNLGSTDIQLKYEYEFIPKGLFNRLIVRLHRFIAQGQTAVWRIGMILERKGAYAEIIQQYANRTIAIRVKGKWAKELIIILEEEIEQLHKGFGERLKYRCLIPCNCSECISSENPHLYDKKNLVLRELKGKLTVECDKSAEDILVRELLEGSVPKSLKYFIIYSAHDQIYLNELKSHLAPLVKKGALSSWDDTMIRPGEEFDKNIQRAFENADIIFMLLSPSLLHEDYIYNTAVRLDRRGNKSKEPTLIPIILRPCNWESTLFANIQVLPRDGTPIISTVDKVEAWTKVIKEIEKVVDGVRFNEASIYNDHIIANTTPFIAHIRDLLAKDDVQTAIQQVSALLKDSPLLDEAVQQSVRYNNVMQQIRLGLVDFSSANIAQNQIRYGVLELLREIEEQEVKTPDIKAEVERFAVKVEKNIVKNINIQAGKVHIGDIIQYGDRKIPRFLTQKPFNTNFFIGRDTDLAAIETDYQKNNHLLVLVNGEGGMGKTTLAAQYWFLNEARYTHLAWVFADRGIGNALISLSGSLGVLFSPNDNEATQIIRITEAINNLDAPCLLVFDNANDATDLEKHFVTLRRLSNCQVLLTSRVKALQDVPVHRVKPLDTAFAVQVFTEHYPKYSESDAPLLNSLLLAVGFNTLVIELLAKNLTVFNKFKTQYSLATLVADLQQRGLFAVQGKAVKTLYQADTLRTETPDSIIAAMYDVAALSDMERYLLNNFAILPAENIPYTRFIELLKPDNSDVFDDPLSSLQQKGWIDYFETTGDFKISPVIQHITKLKNKTTLLDDGKTLIDTLIDELHRDNIHKDNYTFSAIFSRYAETVVAAFDVPNYKAALLCERIGNYYTTIGNLDSAIAFYEKCRAVSQELCVLQPDDKYNKNELAISYSKLGNTHTDLGNLDKALEFYEEYNRLAGALYAANANNVEFKDVLAISYQCLGITHTSLGNLDKALGFYEEYNRLEKELYAVHPNNVEFKYGLAVSYQYLGNTHASLGNLDKALEFYEELNQLSKELYANNPNNVAFKNVLAVSYEKLGETHTTLGNLNKALGFYEEQNKLFEELYAANPNNVVFKNGLAISYAKLGVFSRDQLKSKPKALTYFKQAETLWLELVRDAPQYVKFKEFLGMTQDILKDLD